MVPNSAGGARWGAVAQRGCPYYQCTPCRLYPRPLPHSTELELWSRAVAPSPPRPQCIARRPRARGGPVAPRDSEERARVGGGRRMRPPEGAPVGAKRTIAESSSKHSIGSKTPETVRLLAHAHTVTRPHSGLPAHPSASSPVGSPPVGTDLGGNPPSQQSRRRRGGALCCANR